jgi:hypothetical protein
MLASRVSRGVSSKGIVMHADAAGTALDEIDAHPIPIVGRTGLAVVDAVFAPSCAFEVNGYASIPIQIIDIPFAIS